MAKLIYVMIFCIISLTALLYFQIKQIKEQGKSSLVRYIVFTIYISSFLLYFFNSNFLSITEFSICLIGTILFYNIVFIICELKWRKESFYKI